MPEKGFWKWFDRIEKSGSFSEMAWRIIRPFILPALGSVAGFVLAMTEQLGLTGTFFAALGGFALVMFITYQVKVQWPMFSSGGGHWDDDISIAELRVDIRDKHRAVQLLTESRCLVQAQQSEYDEENDAVTLFVIGDGRSHESAIEALRVNEVEVFYPAAQELLHEKKDEEQTTYTQTLISDMSSVIRLRANFDNVLNRIEHVRDAVNRRKGQIIDGRARYNKDEVAAELNNIWDDLRIVIEQSEAEVEANDD